MQNIVQVLYHDGMEDFPLHVTEGNAGVDVYSAETVFIPKDETRTVSLGISVKLPELSFAILAPRSSTFRNWKVTLVNSIGIIDESFQGENDIWKMCLLAHEDTTICRGDKIGQFVLLSYMGFSVERVDKLVAINRGGFGTSGKR